MLEATSWEEANEDAFASVWANELAEVPPFTESAMYVVTGLLLPIWRWLPDEGCRVYRLQTDDGERIIGRQMSPAWVAQALGADAPARGLGCRVRQRRRAAPCRQSDRPPRHGHGRPTCRTRRLLGRNRRPAESDGARLRDHRMEAPAVRADRRARSCNSGIAARALPGPPLRGAVRSGRGLR